MKIKTKKTNKIKNLRTNILASAISLCLPYSSQAANFDVTVSNDSGTGLVPNTLSWAILQTNTTLEDDTITLKTDVILTDVMKRIIDSNTSIQSDSIRRAIDGDNKYRPLFIKSGNVIIQNLDIVNGMSKGGEAENGGAGAGMGGSVFIYSGNVEIKSVNFTHSQAIAGQAQAGVTGKGGGGMFGYATGHGGGGLFGNGSNYNGGYGGYGNYQAQDAKFGTGGSYTGIRDAGFGGGGAYYSGLGGFGGGGGSGDRYTNGGNGGFGGGGGLNYGMGNIDGIAGYGGNGSYSAGMGGAIFVRSGNVNLENINFSEGFAYASGGAKGLGGAVFVLHSTINLNGNNQGMPSTLATVTTCELSFSNNQATSIDLNGNSTSDIFDLGARIKDCKIFNDGFED